MTKSKKIIQADKIVNFKISIPAWIPDELAEDYAKIVFMQVHGQWLGDIWLEVNNETDDFGKSKKTYLRILMERAGIVKPVAPENKG